MAHVYGWIWWFNIQWISCHFFWSLMELPVHLWMLSMHKKSIPMVNIFMWDRCGLHFYFGGCPENSLYWLVFLPILRFWLGKTNVRFVLSFEQCDFTWNSRIHKECFRILFSNLRKSIIFTHQIETSLFRNFVVSLWRAKSILSKHF